jgi:hypothetical protein
MARCFLRLALRSFGRMDVYGANETTEQIAVVNYCTAIGVPIVHIPNEGKRSVVTGAQLKAMGMQRGFPDLFVPLARMGYHGLFIEMKYGKGKTTKDQEQWIETLRSEGYAVAVCYDANEAIKTISDYLKGIRKNEWEEAIGGK